MKPCFCGALAKIPLPAKGPFTPLKCEKCNRVVYAVTQFQTNLLRRAEVIRNS